MTCSAPTIASASRPRSAARSRRSTRSGRRSRATSGSASSSCSAGAAARPPCCRASSPRSTARSSPRCRDLDVLLPLLAEDKASNPAHYALCVVSEGRGSAATGRRRRHRQAGHRARRDRHRPAPRQGDLGADRRRHRRQELAYLMRAGEPDAMDRMVGFAFGGLAVQLLQRGETAAWSCFRTAITAMSRSTPAARPQVGRRQRALRPGDLPGAADAGRGHADVPVLTGACAGPAASQISAIARGSPLIEHPPAKAGPSAGRFSNVRSWRNW